MFARLTAEGTAASETALCSAHIDRADELISTDPVEPATTEHVDASGNEQLECQVCGATA